MARPTVLVYHADRRYAELVRVPKRGVSVHIAATPSEAAGAVADAEILYAWKFPPQLYAKAGRLKWLQVMGAGVDWALVPELPEHVQITRAPGVFGPWMAEYVLAWCLWVTQRLKPYRDAQRQRRWDDHVLPERLGGKTVTIVGLGDIGRDIARAARGLGMRVLGVSRRGRPVREATRMYSVAAMTRALREADFVVLLLPLTPETRGIIGADALAAMKSTAWLINIARGAVVDEGALMAALEQRRIAGAVLDVFDREPLPPSHPLWKMDNVVVTPHISGPSTADALTPVFNDNLARYLAGRPLRHVVDRHRGY
ncbi:MAG TPA: D-2-hydroxyacid dehydrogenase [Methylomirabilota bacterium]|jgi:glyoxylate/hydroxypyruvate reductase|nr:D-2-hydroxyacid dehydrogenase [Methylomirabilota bacterium]